MDTYFRRVGKETFPTRFYFIVYAAINNIGGIWGNIMSA